MSIFKKQIPEEDLEEVNKFPKKKELTPNKIRVKKEPPKPWGKKERLIVFATFLVSIGITSVLFLSSRSWKLPNFPRIEIPKIDLFKSGTVSLGEKKDFQKEKEDEIIKYFKEKTDKLTGTYSFYIVDLVSGHEFGYRERNIMQAASLIKLPMFALLYQKVEAKEIDLLTLYTLKSSDIRGGSGSLQYKKPGYQIFYKQMAELMGKESDNTSFNIFRNIFSDQTVSAKINELGMDATSLEDNLTSAYDISIFFKKLYSGKIVGEKYVAEILGYLTNTFYEEYIPKGITEVKVAHKFGREVNVTNDAGIILSENPFVLSILSEGIIYKEGDEFIPEFSKYVFEKMK